MTTETEKKISLVDEWLPVQVKDKRMQRANHKRYLSPWVQDFMQDPPLSHDECKELACKILENKDPELITEFVRGHGRFIMYTLYRYFQHFISDDVFAEAVFATYSAALKINTTVGYRNYLMKYIFGYVNRYLRFKRTQVSPSNERICRVGGGKVNVKLTEVPLLGEDQESYNCDFDFGELFGEAIKDESSPFNIVAKKDHIEYIKKQLFCEAEKYDDAKDMKNILNWVLAGNKISRFTKFETANGSLCRFRKVFRKMMGQNTKLFQELHEGLI